MHCKVFVYYLILSSLLLVYQLFKTSWTTFSVSRYVLLYCFYQSNKNINGMNHVILFRNDRMGHFLVVVLVVVALSVLHSTAWLCAIIISFFLGFHFISRWVLSSHHEKIKKMDSLALNQIHLTKRNGQQWSYFLICIIRINFFDHGRF